MTQLERTIEIYKSIENPVWEGAYIYGSITVSGLLMSFVADYSDDLEIELENSQGNIIIADSLVEYDKLQVKFLPPRKEFSFFAKNFDDYLGYFGFLFQMADEFYISNIDGYCNKGQTSSQKIEAYFKILKLNGLLFNVAEHTEKDDANKHNHIIISASGKTEISVVFNSSDISRFVDISSELNIEALREELFSAPHKSTKQALFKKSIANFVSGVKGEERFSCLIDHLSGVIKSYRNNYELFISEFSFEDEKERLEKSKQEYLLKLNEILGGIHSKLLAVPVSLVVVASQMKPSSEDNYFLVNAIILVGALLFALLMWLLTSNQLHSLLAVKTDYISKKNRLRSELRSSLYAELSEAFDQLDTRFRYQRWMIRFVDVLVLLGFMFSLCVFEYHTAYIVNQML